MRTALPLLALLCAAPAPVPALAQSGAFVVRLGHDTLAIERYTRSPDRLEGEVVVRSPGTEHRLYTATFGPGGAIDRFELVVHNVSGDPGPPETRTTFEVQGDTAVVRQPRGDSVVTRSVRLGPGGLPFMFQCFALVEEAVRRARAAGTGRYTLPMLPLGQTEPWSVAVARLGPDSMTIMLGSIGPLRMRVDERGNLLGLSGIGTTMQVTVERVPRLDFARLGKTFAARPLGPLSPADSVKTTIGGASLAVRYHRPSMRGRRIFGTVVPWDRVWRTGANEATTFETSADLVMGGTAVPAGRYSVWTIPSPSGWTLVLNRNTGQWGTEYDAQYDFARLPMQVDALAQPVEQFTIAIEPAGGGGGGGVLKLEWERTSASIIFSPKAYDRRP